MRFAAPGEYRVEGLHGRIERRTGNIHQRSAAYNSLTLTRESFAGLMRRSDVIVDEIDRCLSAAKSPKELISALGMDSHPIIEEMKGQSRHPWDECIVRFSTS